jgi:hypothetical protein
VKRKILAALLTLSVLGIGIRLASLARMSPPAPTASPTLPLPTPAPTPIPTLPSTQGEAQARAVSTLTRTRSTPGADDLATDVEELIDEQFALMDHGEMTEMEARISIQKLLADYRSRWVSATGLTAEDFDRLASGAPAP